MVEKSLYLHQDKEFSHGVRPLVKDEPPPTLAAVLDGVMEEIGLKLGPTGNMEHVIVKPYARPELICEVEVGKEALEKDKVFSGLRLKGFLQTIQNNNLDVFILPKPGSEYSRFNLLVVV